MSHGPRTAGNAAVARAILARQPDLAAEGEAFVNRLWLKEKFRPSTGGGHVRRPVRPGAGRLTIVVKCKFWFADGDPALPKKPAPVISELAPEDPEVAFA